MSLLRSLVASTSSLPAAASFSPLAVRSLSTEAPTPRAASRPSPTSTRRKWSAAVNRAINARLPPRVVPHANQPTPVHPPRLPLETPAKFVEAVGRDLTKKIQGKVDLEKMAWADLMNWRGGDWANKAGLEIRDRRYLMWQISMYKKGKDPRRLATNPKPPKKYRAWGDAVQDGLRIPGARFKFDLTHARRPFGMPGFPFRGFKRE